MWDFLFSKAIKRTSVGFERNNCLRSRYKHHDCQACVDICPERALLLQEGHIRLDESRCNGCGYCCHICPSEAMTMDAERLNQYEQRMNQRDYVCFACRLQGNSENDILVPCIGVVSPELLMIPMLKGTPFQIFYDEGKCKKCKEYGKMASRINENLEWIKDWNESLDKPFVIAIEHNAAKKKGRPKGMSRRELFTLGKSRVRNEVAFLLSDSFAEQSLRNKISLPLRRQYFRLFARQKSVENLPVPGKLRHKIAIPKKTVSSECSLCNRCAVLCPTGALQQQVSDEVKSLTFTPASCIQCCICLANCIHLSKGEGEQARLGELGQPVMLHQARQVPCPRCEEPMNENRSICEDCQLREERSQDLLSL